jgi:hypothetical protein
MQCSVVLALLDELAVTRAFRTSESESADFSESENYGLKKISQKISEILIFSFLKSYYFLYKPHAQISTIVKTS